MTPIVLERNIWIQAPRERVWEAVSNPDQIIQWFAPNLPGAKMQRDSNDKLVIMLGPISVDFALLEAMVDLQQLGFRTLPDRLISTSYTLQDKNDGTSVRVKTSGFEGLADNIQQERMALSGLSWEKVLQNLNAFVIGEALPHPQAFLSPLFGYWRETKATLATERSIWIDGSRERVWQAVTDPKQIQMWSSPSIPWELSALELGGRLFTRDAETGKENYVEIIDVLDPPNRFGTRIVSEEPTRIVKGKTYTLKEEKGGTRLIVTLSGYEQEPEDARWGKIEQDTFGFGMMLQNTKAYIEGKALPFPFGF
jgi:uncharacterized protein YndB with AHSA1/START domain